MKPATEEQIAGWVAALVWLEQTRLPTDHPMHNRVGGSALAETRQDAARAYAQLGKRGRLPSKEALDVLVNNGIDIEECRAKKAAEAERAALRSELVNAARGATEEALRRALDALKGDA